MDTIAKDRTKWKALEEAFVERQAEIDEIANIVVYQYNFNYCLI